MKNLRSVQRAIRYIERKVIQSPGYVPEKGKLEKLQSEREELKKQTPSYLKRVEKRKAESNKQRSLTQKNNYLKKKRSSATEKQKQKIDKQINSNENKKSKSKVKGFKLSPAFEKIMQAKMDLQYKRDQLILNLQSENPKYTKEIIAKYLVKLNEIEEEVNAINEFAGLPVEKLTIGGVKIVDREFPEPGGGFHDDDIFQDSIPFWEVQESVRKKMDKEEGSFDTIEIRFPLGRIFEFDASDVLQYEQRTTALFNEIDGLRTVKGRVVGTPEVNVEYNFTERLIIINL